MRTLGSDDGDRRRPSRFSPPSGGPAANCRRRVAALPAPRTLPAPKKWGKSNAVVDVELCCPPRPTGHADCAPPGRRRGGCRKRVCRPFSTRRWPTTARPAICPRCRRRLAFRPTLPSEKSARAGSGTPPRRAACPRGHREIPDRARLARILRTTCPSIIGDLARRNFRPEFDAFPWIDDERCGSTRGARTHRLSDRRRRHARAVDDRLDAQSRAHDRGVVPDQGPAADWQDGERWFWDTLVDADPRQQRRWAGSGSPAAAPTPRLTSASSIPSSRARSSTRAATTCAAGCPSWAACLPELIHKPWTAETTTAAGNLPRARRRPRVRPRTGAHRLPLLEAIRVRRGPASHRDGAILCRSLGASSPRIHWQALQLWRKRARFHRKPPAAGVRDR